MEGFEVFSKFQRYVSEFGPDLGFEVQNIVYTKWCC